MSDLILRPGDHPPEITPYCQRCDMPVERMWIQALESQHYVVVHAQCCGQQSSTRVGVQTYLQMRATGAKLYVIVRKGSQAGLRNQKARGAMRAV